MKTLSGFDQIILGDDSGRPRVKGRSMTMAQIMVILLELQEILGTIDLSTINQLIATVGGFETHTINTTIHVTEEFKTKLSEIIAAYDAGTIGGGGDDVTGGGTVVFADRANMLTTPGSTGSIGVITTEPFNQYMWDTVSEKWVVKYGNIYTIENMPSVDNFTIPNGTVMIVSPTGEHITWMEG